MLGKAIPNANLTPNQEVREAVLPGSAGPLFRDVHGSRFRSSNQYMHLRDDMHQEVCLKIRVVVLTSPVDPDQHSARSAAIQQTWGSNVAAQGDISGSGCPHLGVTFNEIPQPAIENTTEWLLSFLAEFAEHPGLAWLVKVEDTSGLLPDRLAFLLASYDPNEPLLLGNHMRTKWRPHHLYVSGAGFAVSRAALQQVRDSGGVTLVPPALQTVPDVGFSVVCGRLGVRMPDTRDAAGGERFNVFPPHVCARGVYHDWYREYKTQAKQIVLAGAACCAQDSVLFQYIGPAEQLALSSLLSSTSTAGASALRAGWRWPRPALFDRWDNLLSNDGGAELALLEKLRGWSPRRSAQTKVATRT